MGYTDIKVGFSDYPFLLILLSICYVVVSITICLKLSLTIVPISPESFFFSVVGPWKGQCLDENGGLVWNVLPIDRYDIDSADECLVECRLKEKLTGCTYKPESGLCFYVHSSVVAKADGNEKNICWQLTALNI